MISLPRRERVTDAAVALGGLLLAVALIVVVPVLFRGSALSPLLGHLAVWLPLLGAVVLVSRSRSSDLGLGVRAIDLLWGIGLGLLLRVATTLLELAVYGRAAPAAATLDDGWWLFSALLAPVLIAPVVEELFFRGALLRTVQRLAGSAAAVAVSAIAFAALHMLTATSPAQLLVVGPSTLAFGIAAAVLAVTTGRVGGAIIAHVVFNALVVLPGLF
jgi:membrane protease YdiL (CAAX protease family)